MPAMLGRPQRQSGLSYITGTVYVPGAISRVLLALLIPDEADSNGRCLKMHVSTCIRS